MNTEDLQELTMLQGRWKIGRTFISCMRVTQTNVNSCRIVIYKCLKFTFTAVFHTEENRPTLLTYFGFPLQAESPKVTTYNTQLSLE